MIISIFSDYEVLAMVFEQIMSEKTGPELELDKIVEEGEGDIGKEDNNVTNDESSVAISEPKEQNVVEEIPSLSCRDEENVEVNIIGNSGFKGVEDNCVDLTVTESSSSSSFGHTDTSSDSAFGDSEEVESQRRHKVWRKPLLLRYVSQCFSYWTELGSRNWAFCWLV